MSRRRNLVLGLVPYGETPATYAGSSSCHVEAGRWLPAAQRTALPEQTLVWDRQPPALGT